MLSSQNLALLSTEQSPDKSFWIANNHLSSSQPIEFHSAQLVFVHRIEEHKSEWNIWTAGSGDTEARSGLGGRRAALVIRHGGTSCGRASDTEPIASAAPHASDGASPPRPPSAHSSGSSPLATQPCPLRPLRPCRWLRFAHNTKGKAASARRRKIRQADLFRLKKAEPSQSLVVTQI